MILQKVSSEHAARRKALMENHDGAVFVLPAARQSNYSVGAFRQEPNFNYLTGFDEADAILVLAPDSQKKFKSVLFVHPRERYVELWEGERYGVDRAIAVFGMDEAYPLAEFDQQILKLLSGASELHFHLGANEDFDRKMTNAVERFRQSLGRTGRGLLPVFDSTSAIGELRIRKSASEIAALKKACEISAAAHVSAMKEVRPGSNEHEIQALLEYEFVKRGCSSPAYGSIVAGGKNATCLHYRRNNDPLKSEDLLLIDAGGHFEGYNADITRTFPVGKSFSTAQEKIYRLVLKAQKEAINICKPGLPYAQIHARACEVLHDGLRSLGILKGDKLEEIRKYYPHGTGHWLGMDVHDVGLYQVNGEPRRLESGMVFTVEPGLYFQEYDAGLYPAEYANIGIRIEDDLLITESGCEILTHGVPKEVEEVLKLRSTA